MRGTLPRSNQGMRSTTLASVSERNKEGKGGRQKTGRIQGNNKQNIPNGNYIKDKIEEK